jgi:hypothetical protein
MSMNPSVEVRFTRTRRGLVSMEFFGNQAVIADLPIPAKSSFSAKWVVSDPDTKTMFDFGALSISHRQIRFVLKARRPAALRSRRRARATPPRAVAHDAMPA